MTSPSHQRAFALQQQRRYGDAEKEWRRAILESPNDAHGRSMLAICLVELDRLSEATDEARQAIGISPDEPTTHYTLGYVLLHRDRLDAELAAGAQDTQGDLAAVRDEDLVEHGWPRGPIR